jgi:hypothetical protein
LTITSKQIANIRLTAQQIGGSAFTHAKEVVGWMGAMQAQDYPMAKWAIGLRLPGSKQQTVDDAIDSGEIFRTHVMRPTLHFVTAADVRWLLELTAPQIKASLRARHRELKMTDAAVGKSQAIMEKALANGHYLTRKELVEHLKKGKIATDNNRAFHLFLLAELNGLICSGPSLGNQQTYALMDERVPAVPALARDEALARLAQRYFTSHGPATLKDFVWWSGLSVADAREALDAVKGDLVAETSGSSEYWLSETSLKSKKPRPSACLLPSFDEYLISYRDRSAALSLVKENQVVSSNGIFWPLILIDGQVAGLWKRATKNDVIEVNAEFFLPQDKKVEKLVEAAVALYGDFLGKRAHKV